jgi:hypothetical protein
VTTPSDPRQGALPEYQEPADGGHSGAPEQTFSVYSETATVDRPERGFNTLVSRPAEMWAGAIFLTLAALPLAVLGGGLALLPGQFGVNLRQKVTSAGTSISADTLITLFRVAGLVLLVVAVAFGVLAWLAIKPNRTMRLWVSVLAVLAVLGMVFAIAVSSPDPVSVGVAVLAAAGAILLYLPRSEEFVNARR